MMEVRHARGLEAVRSMAPEWRELADLSTCGPMAGPDWIHCLVDAYGYANRLHLFSVWRADCLLAVLPLLLQPSRVPGLPWPWLSSCSTGISLSFDLVARPGEAGAVAIASLWGELASWRAWTYLELHPVPEGGRAEVLQASAAAAGWRVQSRLEFASHYIPLERGLETGLAQTKRDFRAELRRTRRRLQERGQLWLETVMQPLAGDLEAFFQLEAAGWKGHAQHGNAVLLKSPSQRWFYIQMAAAMADRGQFVMHRLHLDQRVIAASFGLIGVGRYVALKWSYDPEFAAFGPGHLLIEAMLDDCAGRGLQRFELGGEDFAYKHKWTRTTLPHYFLLIFRPNWRGRALHWWKRHRTPVG